MNGRVTRIARLVIALAGLFVAAAVGWVVFVRYPGSLAELLGVLLVVGVAILGARVGSRIAGDLFPTYNVAAVSVEGPITRDGGGGGIPVRPGGASADAIVEQIERADADESARALLVELNTPGGAVLPSDDIRRAAADFDGPTIAYTTDMCASGGYWIATGCDALWAREASVVGSIGVRSELVTAEELAERIGLSYEGFSRGEFKDAGSPLKDLTDDQRDYLQSISDDFYDLFVERVSEARDLTVEEVRDTEARIYLGEEALSLGLVDELGGREEIEDRLADDLGEDIAVEEFEPEHPLAQRIGLGARRVAHAVGAGIAGAVVDDREVSFELR